MVRFLALFGMLFITVLTRGQTVIYVDNCSENVSNGRYVFNQLHNGKNEYTANRVYTPGYVVAPQIVSWNESASRWEVIVTIAAFGPPTQQVAAVNPDLNPFNPLDPPETGWTSISPGCSNGISLRVPQISVSQGGDWSNPATWSSGMVPRDYDDVVISAFTTLDVDATVQNFQFGEGYPILSGPQKLTVTGDAAGLGGLFVEELVMAGSELQQLGIFPNLENGKLVIDNSSGVRLSASGGPHLLSSQFLMRLSLESGHLYLGDFNLTVSEILGAGASGHIVTNGNGALAMNAIVPENQPYERVFPVSYDGEDYRPLVISLQPNSASAPGPGGTIPYYARLQFTVRTSPLLHTAPHSGYVNAQWDITKTPIPAQAINTYPYREGLFTVKFQWNDTDESEHFERSSSLVAKRYSSSIPGWESKGQPGSSEGTGPYSFTVTHQHEFSSWSVFNAEDPLPVVLSSFEVRREQETVVVSWETVTETDSDLFEIEHSNNAVDWHKIGSRTALGHSSRLKSYQYIHTMPLNGQNYYRLKMIDADGSFSYSELRSVRYDAPSVVARVFPNPAFNHLSLDLNTLREPVDISILGLAGGQWPVRSERGGQSISLDVSHLPAGIYLLKLRPEGSPLEVHRVVIGR